MLDWFHNYFIDRTQRVRNFNKSKFQIFGNKSKLNKLTNTSNFDVGDNQLERVEYYNYLGVTLDSELNFEKEMAEAYAKYSYRLYTLSLIRKDINQFAATSIVKTMLIPYFDYMFVSSACTDQTITKAKRFVNRSLRIALRVNRYTHVNELYDRTKVMKSDIRQSFNILKLKHRKVYVDTDHQLSGSHVTTRLYTAPVLPVPTPKMGEFLKSYYYIGHTLWNSLPANLSRISDINVFKRELKRFVMQFN